MTREEFEQYAKENGLVVWSKEMSEKAIKALEQEPTTENCESCRYYGLHNEVCNYCYKCSLWTVGEPTTKNDLGVDKFDKAINQSDLEEWIIETFPDWCEGDVRLIMDHMDEMPSVTPQEPKTGHWIPTYGNVKCSVCGSVKDSREVGKATHYCDFCGAKMEGEE